MQAIHSPLKVGDVVRLNASGRHSILVMIPLDKNAKITGISHCFNRARECSLCPGKISVDDLEPNCYLYTINGVDRIILEKVNDKFSRHKEKLCTS